MIDLEVGDSRENIDLIRHLLFSLLAIQDSKRPGFTRGHNFWATLYYYKAKVKLKIALFQKCAPD